MSCHVMSCYVMSCDFRKRIILGLRRCFSVSKFTLMTLWPWVLASSWPCDPCRPLEARLQLPPATSKVPCENSLLCVHIFALYIYMHIYIYIYMDKWNVLCKFVNENSFVSEREGGIRFRFTEKNTIAPKRVQFYSHKAWVNVSTFRCNRIEKCGFIFCFSFF